ncbi:cathepsin L [Pelomyxa schiedti]|nr:cathepsin L [Pelomyxa schiedti]
MKAVVILAVIIGCALATKDYEGMFRQWMREYGKTYPQREFTHRLAVFTSNAKFVERHNSLGESWTVALNEFADLSNEEFRSMYLMKPRLVQSTGTYQPGAEQITAIDWRKMGAVTDVKNQGQCGSCWSFGATAAHESCHQIYGASHTLVSMSEQQLVDCAGIAYGDLGCRGGLPDNAYRYLIATGGQETEANYPYTAARGTCVVNSTKFVGRITSYKDIPSKSEADLQTAVLNVGPVSVGIDASGASFQLYKTGVYCPTRCSEDTLDHAVTVVGQDTGSDGDYYIVKNSWGVTWGQKGYLWMCANKNNNCGIATNASYPEGCADM